MIKINLLPVDRRKTERTPLPRFFLILSTAGVAAGLTLYILWILIQIKDVSDRIDHETKELARLQPFVQEHTKLSNELSELERKLNEIRGLVSRDVELGWWRAVDALWSVVHAHPKVWIEDLRAIDGRTSGGELKRIDPNSSEVPPYAVSMRCNVAGNEVAAMTQFRLALKDHPVLQETLTTVNFNVDWRVSRETGFEEAHSIAFSVTLFAPSTPPKRKAPTPAAATPGPSETGGAVPTGAPPAAPEGGTPR